MRERLRKAKTESKRFARRLGERGRWTRRGDTGYETQAKSVGAGWNRGAGGERNGLGRSNYRGKTGGSREGGERRCRFER